MSTAGGTIGDKIAVGGRKFPPMSGRRLHLLQDGRILAIVSDSSIHLVDTTTQKAMPQIVYVIENPFGPEGGRLFALSKATGKRLLAYDLGYDSEGSTQVAIGSDTVYVSGSGGTCDSLALSLPETPGDRH